MLHDEIFLEVSGEAAFVERPSSQSPFWVILAKACSDVSDVSSLPAVTPWAWTHKGATWLNWENTLVKRDYSLIFPSFGIPR